MTTVVAGGGSDRKGEPYPWMILLDMMVLCVRWMNPCLVMATGAMATSASIEAQ